MKLQKIALSFIALTFATTNLFAQPPGGMGGGMGMNRPPMDMEYGQMPDLLEMTGYFEFDESEIFKKLKIKDNATKAAITRALVEYSKGYEAVGINYITEINAIKAVQSKMSQHSGDRTNMRNMMQGNRENSQKIRNEMVTLHEQLSENAIPAILNEKQNKLWIKYYKYYTQSKGFKLNMPQREENGRVGKRPQQTNNQKDSSNISTK